MPKYKFKRQSRRIEPAEMDTILEMMPDAEYKACIAALYVTGARISEVLALNTGNIMKRGTDIIITIVTLKKRDNENTPFRETRNLMFDLNTTPYVNIILNYVDTLRHKRISKMFTLSRQMVWYWIKKANENCSPHIFRHSRLQKLADSNANAHEIRLWAGHSSVNTSTHYIEQSEKALHKLKRLID